ncbi:hypothetical protein EDB84DRAFT_1449813 [Lactarius hengduanensis]|nr:hypothetical protein EDB84DRAFT_1449813 [Lactarius hengduanensis]
MTSVGQPSRWVQLILKENIRESETQLERTTPLPSIRILASPDARHYKERSVVLTSYSLSSSMDEHALESGYFSPSSYLGRRARAPTPRHHSSTQPHPPALQGDLGSPGHSEYPQSGAHPSYPLPVHRAYTRPEPSPSPAPSSSSSGLARPRAHGQTEDRLQRARPRGLVAHPQASRSSSHLDPGPSKPRRGKRKRPTGSESGTSAPQPIAAHRDTGGPQRSHRRHYNIAEKTQSTMLPSGGMYMTFPLDIPSPEPDTEGRAGPPPFEHGPTELPPRPYESNPQVTEREGSGPERPAKRGRLPADVMDHLPTIEGRLHKIEVAVKEYVDSRNDRAVEKSKLPGP